jgi:hypothetical protein
MVQLFFGSDGTPLLKPEDVIPFLGKKSHWREGRSAFETAHSWLEADGIPTAVRAVLETDPAFRQATLIEATFEKKTDLDTFGRPSQTDILALLSTGHGHVLLSVEAKVDESFGPLVSEWADGSIGKAQRLKGLVDRLNLTAEDVPNLRYQLLHRTVAALIEGEQAGVRDAALVIQSFSPASVRAGFDDFRAFAFAFGAKIDEPGRLSTAVTRGRIGLRLGWAECSPRSPLALTGTLPRT